ncbi:TPA: type VI secretion system baseplate subunit TssK [Escherichia coli]|nr:type VI secretion system baseplate subunit TssK [Escherichia coli]
MKIHRPLWAEGTFLSSQQFQQQARWEAFSNDSIAQLCIRHPWGIANVLFDRDALTSGKLKTQAVRLRFADGTLIDSDVSDVLPLACDLRALKNDSAIVLLALNGVPLVPLTSVPAALPLRLENQYFALDMHSDAAKSMLESGCCMIYAPGTMGDLKPELFAVLRT